MDLCQYLANPQCVRVFGAAANNFGKYADDNAVMTLEFANGSVANIVYTANGDRVMSKERIEVFGGGCSAVLEDFRTLELLKNGHRSVEKARVKRDKGHNGECEAFVRAVKTGGESPIAFESIVNTTLATIRITESIRNRKPEQVLWPANEETVEEFA